mgnify:CR=1 FL=1
MILYHGSKSIVEFPEIRVQRYNKDFYFGFYCTLYPEQAIRWAIRFDGIGYLNEYSYTPDDSLKVKRFPEMTEEWLDFIIACRSGKPHNYDIVIGAMANDQIYNFISDYIDGVITREQFWVLAKFKYPTHQINFCTERALKCLKYRGYEVVE